MLRDPRPRCMVPMPWAVWIQIFTREASAVVQTDASLGTGTDGQQQLGASVRGSSGMLGYSLGVSREKATGISVIANPASFSFNPMPTASPPPVRMPNSAKLSRDHTVSLNLLHSDTDYQFDSTPWPNPLGFDTLTSDAHARAILNNATLKWDAQWLSVACHAHRGKQRRAVLERLFPHRRRCLGQQQQVQPTAARPPGKTTSRWTRDVLSLAMENRSESVDSSTAYTVTSRDVRSALVSYAFNRASWNALLVARNDDNSQFGNVNNWSASGGVRLTDACVPWPAWAPSFQAPLQPVVLPRLWQPGAAAPAQPGL